MTFIKNIFLIISILIYGYETRGQIVINEGSNKNYSIIADEDGEFEDWIELYNAGTSSVDLYGYTLTDNVTIPNKWVLPHLVLPAGGFTVIYCSGKNRYGSDPFTTVLNTGVYNPHIGWNIHNFTTPFYWDGVSNIVLNVCSYNDMGYTENSIHNQTSTSYNSTVFSYIDGSNSSCYDVLGSNVAQRPNIQFNGLTIDNGTLNNSNTNYPAPYGNWYWSSHHQILYRASELSAAGLSAGNINSLAFDVASTIGETYTYMEYSLLTVSDSVMSNEFYPLTGFRNHTNFNLSSGGEEVFLFSPSGLLTSQLNIDCEPTYDLSFGCYPDANTTTNFFDTPTPGFSNNSSLPTNAALIKPILSVVSGIYTSPFTLSITNPNPASSQVYYTTDGSEPTSSSTLYTGTPINISSTQLIRAKAIQTGYISSPSATASYLFNIDHNTPIISVITDDANVFGATGIFDNPFQDWLRPAYAEYFDSTTAHNLLFSQKAGIRMDGGLGGSRSHPQRSFRLKWDDATLGDGPLTYAFITDKSYRIQYSDFYLRNGSNQWLTLPYKDASQVQMMAKGSNNYYSAMRPVTVYINGQYFGLYELREKFNKEMFNTWEGAMMDSIELLSLSAYYGFTLRALEGSVENFVNDYNDFVSLNPMDTSYWTQADRYFDMKYYCDYIIAESWMGNTDWPGNNIKIYRSNTTDWRWRFCLIDLELCMNPNGWTNCTNDHIAYMLGQSTLLPYINIWLQSMQNVKFKNYFINRFADQMNTLYLTSRLHDIENTFYNLMVDEMSNEYQRWGDPTDIPGQMTSLYNNHIQFQNELACRTTEVRNHIQANFALPQQVDLTLNTIPAGAGKIRVSTITPDTYPWNGVYFDGVPIEIEAIANNGYTFSHWEQNGLINDTAFHLFNDTLANNNTSFTAYFTTNPIGINENSLSYTLYPIPSKEFLTLQSNNHSVYNIKYEIIDYSGKTIEDGIFAFGNNANTIRIAHLDKGVYFLKINDKNSTEVLKFVKE